MTSLPVPPRPSPSPPPGSVGDTPKPPGSVGDTPKPPGSAGDTPKPPGSALARSLRSLGAGADGAVFQGQDEQGRPCTVHRIRADVAVDPVRRRRLMRRLAFHEQAAREGVRSLLQVRGVILEQNPPVIVVEHTLSCLADLPGLAGASSGPAYLRVVRLFTDLAQTLALAHTEGIVHGALSPRSVRLRGTPTNAAVGAHDVDNVDNVDNVAGGLDGVALSFLGLRTSSDGRADELTRLLWPLDAEEEPRSVDDAYAFGGLLCLAVAGEAAALGLLRTGPRAAQTMAPLESTSRAPAADDPARADHPLMLLARDLLDAEPAWRPTLADAAERLGGLLRSLVDGGVDKKPAHPGTPLQGRSGPGGADDPQEAATQALDPSSMRAKRPGGSPPAGAPSTTTKPLGDGHDDAPRHVGRFRLVSLLGAGAMGTVYRGVDEDTGAVVAVKLLQKSGTPSPKALKRFRKEARLLSELTNPGIARFLDAGEENGQLYLVTELVEGMNLSQIVKAKGPFAERDAVAITADLLRALVDVHDNGIVHRDIKPENMILVDDALTVVKGTRVKLIDFGVARHYEETQSLAMTREGAVLGTPLYMAPEQARGGVVDARTDIYAVGTSLFELLIGRPPFAGKGIALVLGLQIEQVPPKPSELRPDVSNEVSRVVARALEKDPALRFQDAREMLSALLPLIEEPAEKLDSHPKPPSKASQSWTFTWDLSSSPAALWPYVSNTERLNQAIGQPAVTESASVVDGDVTLHGKSRQAGFALAWKENPFEWIYQRRLGVLREYSEGPLRWYKTTLDLQPITIPGKTGAASRGTRLVHTIELEPRGLLGRAAASVEVGVRARRGLDRTYRRIDDLLQGRLGDSAVQDAFEDAPHLAADKEARFHWLEKQAVTAGGDPETTARLGDWLRHASAQDISRIRPVALARRLGLDETLAINACYAAAGAGLLVPLWDLLCPTCRVASSMEETLKALKDHSHCEVCNVSFAIDLATTIELVFKVHPSLREADTQTYCISSPAHTPHVMAQVRLGPGKVFVVDVDLPEGAYQLAGRRLGYSASFRVRHQSPKTRWQVPLSKGPPIDASRAFAAGRQEITLVNDTGREQLVRIERTTPRDDVLTAARALSSPLFKRLFPGEVLAPGALLRVAAVTLMLAEVRAPSSPSGVTSSDDHTFEKLYTLYRAVDQQVGAHGGTVVKLQGEGVLAVFDDPAAAVRCATSLGAVLRALTATATVRCAVHRGPAGAVTLNEHVDYFGRVVHELVQLAARARPGELLLSDVVRSDPAVEQALGLGGVQLQQDGTLDDIGHRLLLPLTQLAG